MIAGLLAGCLTAVVLSVFRLRADHHLRAGTAAAVETPEPMTGRWRLPRRGAPRAGPTELAGWCDALAREVRTGASLGAALRTVPPPAGTTLAAIPHALSRGVPLEAALAVAAVSADEAAALTVLASCAQHGGPAAQPLDQVAATLRRRAADAAERAVHSAQARLSALVMTVLPGAVLLLLLTTSPSVRSVTMGPLGVTVVVAGLGLNVTGWLWMRRIIAGRQR